MIIYAWTHRVSSKVGVDDQALPWRHDWPGHLQWQCDGCFRDQQRREGGLLFNVFFLSMLSHAVQDLEKRVYIRYRMDGSLFDLRRLTAKTKSLQTLLQEVLFADDCALVAHAEQDLQRMLDNFSEASKLFGLTISLGKTQVLH